MRLVPGSSWAKARAMPRGLALRLIRQAVAAVYDDETADAGRRRLAMRLDQAIVRLITTETRLLEVEAGLAPEHESHMERADALLGASDPRNSHPLDVLAERARVLGERLKDASPDTADEIWGLLRDIAGTDHAGRQALEQAIAETRDSGVAGPHDSAGEAAKAEARPLDVDGFDTYLADRDWAAPRPRAAEVEMVVGGQSKHTYLVSVDPQEGPEAWRGGVVVRMDTGYFDNSVLDEYALMTRLFQAGLPVAEPLLLEADKAAFGQPFMVSRRLDGKAAGMILDAVGASSAEAFALAAALGRLHSVPLDRLVDSPPTDLPQVVEESRRKIEELWRDTTLTESVAVELGHLWIREHAHELAGQQPVMVHGDASLHNILVDRGRLTGLLDWEFAHVGHPAEDLAYCRPAVERVADWDAFLQRYRECGGREVSERELNFFGAFCQLRNASLCAQVMDNVVAGRITTFDMFVTSVDTFSRMEAVLAQQLHAAFTADRAAAAQ
ncbi:phosphotransferase family protein [Streptosporangium sp. NPDC006013]|uniref:phosphotransferase family protein n=1 Tax=Streptosporangium sp. NPDC006013 TaxID=3155596 RepID=UPI0033B17784